MLGLCGEGGGWMQCQENKAFKHKQESDFLLVVLGLQSQDWVGLTVKELTREGKETDGVSSLSQFE